MKSMIVSAKVALAALVFVTFIHPALAAPPHTGILGQTLIHFPGGLVEIEPGVFVDYEGDVSVGVSLPFTIFSAHSGREIERVSPDPDGIFEVLLPPGDYIIVPDDVVGLMLLTRELEVSVSAKKFSDVVITYGPTPFTIPVEP